jgi:hypothetical protein
MFDLNDIWRAYDLKASQAPSQWRNKVRNHLTRTANMQVGFRIEKGKGKVNYTLATLEALYAYAMWVNKVKNKLYETRNLRSRRMEGNKEGGWQTLATLNALYAYAMWVDIEFYMAVVEAFALLTNKAVIKCF